MPAPLRAAATIRELSSSPHRRDDVQCARRDLAQHRERVHHGGELIERRVDISRERVLIFRGNQIANGRQMPLAQLFNTGERVRGARSARTGRRGNAEQQIGDAASWRTPRQPDHGRRARGPRVRFQSGAGWRRDRRQMCRRIFEQP
jgi:hypothetical protein